MGNLEQALDLGQGVYTQSENDNLLNAKAPIASPTFTGTPTINGSDIYREDNILGTVSQSAGVPTGAIIERGSNANGEYVKFADGTMICFVQSDSLLRFNFTANTRNSSNIWTYPASFTSSGVAIHFFVIGVASSLDYEVRQLTTNNRTSTSAQIIGLFTRTQEYRLGAIAIGRWY